MAAGIRRETKKEPIGMTEAERLAAARRTKEGQEQIYDSMGDIDVFDNIDAEGDFTTRGSVRGKENRLGTYGTKESATPDKASGFEGNKKEVPTFASDRQRFLHGGVDRSKLVGEGGTSDEKTISALADMYGSEEILNVLNDPRVQAVTRTGAYTAASHRQKISMINDAIAGNLTAEDLQPAAPPAPAPEPEPEPEPAVPPAPASVAPPESGFAGEPPSPLSAVQRGAEPVDIFQQSPAPTPEPMDSTTEEQPEVAGVAPEMMDFSQQQPPPSATQVTPIPDSQPQDIGALVEAEMAKIPGVENMSPEEVQYAQELITQQIAQATQKSEPMLNFNATKGDELLKGIKDKFWRQGY